MVASLRRTAVSLRARFPSPVPPAVLALALLLASPVTPAADRKPERPAGSEHSCAAVVGGGVRCWGANFSGQLGDGTNVNRNAPVGVWGLTGAASVIAAGSEHTCAVVAGVLGCWGANHSGQLGDGTNVNRSRPAQVVGLAGEVTAVSAGGEHTCAVTAGRVRCWGANASGQLGDGTYLDRNTPVEVVGLPAGVIAVAAGSEHTCALTSGGAVWCWGANFSGQLGDGTNVNRTLPVGVAGLVAGIGLIAAGSEHTCALSTAGAMRCWGANFSGQLGDGTNANRSTPVAVVGLGTGGTDVAAGSEHTCAVAGGGVKCWGTNRSGQLGDDTDVNRNVPVNVVGLSAGVTELAGGSVHTCALIAGGAVACWGANFSGQLGDATNVARKTPVNVPGLPTVRPSVRVRIL